MHPARGARRGVRWVKGQKYRGVEGCSTQSRDVGAKATRRRAERRCYQERSSRAIGQRPLIWNTPHEGQSHKGRLAHLAHTSLILHRLMVLKSRLVILEQRELEVACPQRPLCLVGRVHKQAHAAQPRLQLRLTEIAASCVKNQRNGRCIHQCLAILATRHPRAALRARRRARSSA